MNAGAVKGSHDSEERAMQTITTIGLDIAKSVFQHQPHELGKPTWRCLNRLSLSSAWLAPLNRGSLNSAHIHGTDVPVEEPSTASQTDLRLAEVDVNSPAPPQGISMCRSGFRRAGDRG